MLHVKNDNDNDDDDDDNDDSDNDDSDDSDDSDDNDDNNDDNNDDIDDNDLLEHLSSNKLYCYDFNSVEKKTFNVFYVFPGFNVSNVQMVIRCEGAKFPGKAPASKKTRITSACFLCISRKN